MFLGFSMNIRDDGGQDDLLLEVVMVLTWSGGRMVMMALMFNCGDVGLLGF